MTADAGLHGGGCTDQFATAGYLSIGRVISDSAAIACGRFARRLLEEVSEDNFSGADGSSRTAFGVHARDPFLGALSRLCPIFDFVKDVLGGPFYIHQSKVNTKLPFGGAGWGWHQDFATWHAVDGMPEPRVVNVVVLLSHVSEFNGPVIVIPGSHHFNWSSTDADAGTIYPSVPAGTVTALAGEKGLVALKGSPGEAFAFHGNLVHASGENISPWQRDLLIVTYNRTDNAARAFKRLPALSSRDFTPVAAAADAELGTILSGHDGETPAGAGR
jgi:L-proline 4-hydroxylase